MEKFYTTQGALNENLEEETISYRCFIGVQGNICLKDVTFENCVFKNVDFDNICFEGVDFINSIFENCDLSNKNFNERLIKKVIFKNSKLTGVYFIDCFIKDSVFDGVSARYINMSSAKINNLKLVDSDFS